jgi:hypothetical protein
VLGPLSSRLQGVAQGEDEDPAAPMRRSDVARRDGDGAGSVAKSVQVGPHLAQPARGAAGDVLDDDGGGAQLGDDSAKLVPESRAIAGEPSTFAGGADVLAGESSDEEIHGIESCTASMVHVLHGSIGAREVLREDASTERVDLDLPADDGEQAHEGEGDDDADL